jgi:sugar phosphate isomerase/epimerase
MSHDQALWASFVAALQEVSYDGVLSIENEDERQPAAAGVEEAASFMRPILRELSPES